MPYTVNKTNNSESPNQYTVQDGVINTQTDLSFIGKGYAGYGESIAENFLHLLENFSNSTAPTKPIKGQLWFDSANNRLKVYTGADFVPSGGNVPYQATEPSAINQGDLWIDSDTGQLYFYNGSSSILVGPPSSTGTTNGFVYETILDSGDVSRNITKWYNDDTLIAIISDNSFTPKSTISGFTTIRTGITLNSSTNVLEGALIGDVTGNADTATEATNVTVSANNSTNETVYLTFVDGATGTQGIETDTGLTYNPSTNVLTTTASSAQYADLAEIYESDAEYEVGTVVIFGGDKEITISKEGNDTRIAGVISENPAYLMNAGATGLPVALMGKVKCKVVGHINKGDMLSSHPTHHGVAKKTHDPQVGEVIGKALEDYDSEEIGTINIVVGRC
jgi:hypothetical protein